MSVCFVNAWLVVHTVLDIDPNDPANIPVLIAFELTQPGPQSFCVKDLVFRNIFSMLLTLESCHFEISPLNDAAPWNIPDMSLTFDTSHPAMEQKGGFTCRQLPRALRSCALDRGVKPCVGSGQS